MPTDDILRALSRNPAVRVVYQSDEMLVVVVTPGWGGECGVENTRAVHETLTGVRWGWWEVGEPLPEARKILWMCGAL